MKKWVLLKVYSPKGGVSKDCTEWEYDIFSENDDIDLLKLDLLMFSDYTLEFFEYQDDFKNISREISDDGMCAIIQGFEDEEMGGNKYITKWYIIKGC